MPHLHFHAPTLLLSAFCILAATAPAHAEPNAERGKALYQVRCAACHAPDFNGVGPSHRGVFKRNAAAAKGFAGYSAALKRSGLIWTEANLDKWLADPEALVPGQGMGISLSDAAERADVIAFLRTLAEKKE